MTKPTKLLKKPFIRSFLYIGLILLIFSIYIIIISDSNILRWLLSITTFAIIIIFVFYFRDVKELIRISPERFISIVGFVIAFIAFMQTSIQMKLNNEQFERNQINSENLYRNQAIQAKTLNNLLIQELTEIQKVNKTQNLITERLLISVDKQLELSKQSLDDYVMSTRANLTMGTIEITNADTLSSDSVYVKITNILFNEGRRNAEKIESRHIVIYNNRQFSNMGIRNSPFMPTEDKRELHYSVMIPISETEKFYYWIQIRYYDDKLKQFFDNSYYYKYYKVGNTFNFYWAKDPLPDTMRKIIDKELLRRGLSLTIN